MAIIKNYFGCNHTCSTNEKEKHTREHIRVEGHKGTWYVIDQKYYRTKGWYFLLEHETYGDEAADVIISADYSLVLDDVWNGFDDLEEAWTFEEWERSKQRDLKVIDRTDFSDKIIKLDVQWHGVYYSVIVQIENKFATYFYRGKQPDDSIDLEQAIEAYLGIEIVLPF